MSLFAYCEDGSALLENAKGTERLTSSAAFCSGVPRTMNLNRSLSSD